MMMNKWMRVLCAVLALATLVPGLGAAMADSMDVAMGRYVEVELVHPFSGYLEYTQRDGVTYGINPNMNVVYESRDMVNWTQRELAHTGSREPTSAGTWGLQMDAEGRFLLFDWGIEEGKGWYGGTLRRVQDGVMEEIPIGLTDEQKSMAMLLRILPTGEMVFAGHEGVFLLSPDGAVLWECGAENNEEFAASDTEIAMFAYGNPVITILSVATGEKLREIESNIAPNENRLVAFAPDGSMYLACAGGIYRMNAGGTLWEQIVDGGLTTLSKPSSYPLQLLFDPDGNPVIVYNDRQDNALSLVAYRFDESAPAEPNAKLSVYSLYDSQTLRQAVNQFQSRHPEAMVEITVALPEGTAMTRDDAIRTLNTELLAGKGPDLLLLDGLPTESYIDKGILMDLSSLVGPMIADGTLLPNIAGMYERDGALRAVPARFLIPSIWGDVDGMESLSGLAAWAEANPEEMALFSTEADQMVSTFYLSSAPAWFNEDGSLDQAKIESFLRALVAIRGKWNYEAVTERIGMDLREMGMPAYVWEPYKPEIGENSMIESGNSMFLAEGLVAVAPYLMRGLDSMMTNNGVLEYLNAGRFAPMAGQAERVFVPGTVLAIAAGSGREQLAMQFIETVLSKDIQEAYLADGFPVNARALDADQLREESVRGYLYTSTRDGGTLSSAWPDRAMRDEIRTLIETLDTPSVPDFTLYSMLVEACEQLFEGRIDAAQAAADVCAKANAYLSE